MSSPRSLVRLALALLLSVTALAACGSDSEASADPGGGDGSSTTGGSSSGGGDASGEFVIKFADPGNHGIIAYAKREGSFDEALAEVGASIEWVPAAGAFSANFDLLQAGTINTHEAAVSPIIGALSNGLDFRIFSISEPAEGGGDGIVATADSGIETVEDLAGTRVAVNGKAHGEWILLQALAEAGVDPDTVERVPIQPPDAAAAFASGEIDAWATFGSFYATALSQGGVEVISTDDLEHNDDVGVVGASTAALEENPEAYVAFVEVYAQLAEQAREDPEDFVNVFEDSGPEAYEGAAYDAQVEQVRNSPIPHVPGPEDVERVQRVLDLFIDNGVVEGSIDIDSVVFDAEAGG